MTDTTRRLVPKRIAQDIQALNSLEAIANYAPMRPEASHQTLQRAYQAMEQSQQDEVVMEAALRPAATMPVRPSGPFTMPSWP